MSETWLCDLVSERVGVYRPPAAHRYREVQSYTRGGSLAPGAFPDITLRVHDLIG